MSDKKKTSKTATETSASKAKAAAVEKTKNLDLALLQIEKQFGKGSIMKLGAGYTEKVEPISTGALSLDVATGIGGVPRGRIIEIFGPESSGKTTLTLSVVANLQKSGGVAAFIDAEHALAPTYPEKIGAKPDDLLISQPDSGEPRTSHRARRPRRTCWRICESDTR